MTAKGGDRRPMVAPQGTGEQLPVGITEDHLCGGRVVLRQPADGFRAAIDPVLLAASCPANSGESVLELGAGTGAATLCLAQRVAGVRVMGLERQRDLVRLASENATLNRVADRVSFIIGDILAPPPRLSPGGFDHVIANPPFLEAGTASRSPMAGRATAAIEGDADLAAWVRLALAMVHARGTVTVIHRADRLEAVLTEFAGRAGEIVIFPLWAGVGKPARRVLVRARKATRTPTRLDWGLVLHEADGSYTPEAEAVLRHGAALVL
ncbi:MAG TPA: methyltransferase domain-containing protein [Stellaceae bacterium]|nr:methyltransferase domain-containing protein [Stellaceae bacterium]